MNLECSYCFRINCLTDLKNLAHLDRVADSAASCVVVVAFYSRVSSDRSVQWYVCLSAFSILVNGYRCQLSKSVSRNVEGAVCPLQSCGICKEMLKHYGKLCKEVQAVSQAPDWKAHTMTIP